MQLSAISRHMLRRGLDPDILVGFKEGTTHDLGLPWASHMATLNRDGILRHDGVVMIRYEEDREKVQVKKWARGNIFDDWQRHYLEHRAALRRRYGFKTEPVPANVKKAMKTLESQKEKGKRRRLIAKKPSIMSPRVPVSSP